MFFAACAQGVCFSTGTASGMGKNIMLPTSLSVVSSYLVNKLLTFLLLSTWVDNL